MEEKKYDAISEFINGAKVREEEKEIKKQENEKKINCLSVCNGLIITVTGGVIILIITICLKYFGIV